MTTAIGERSAVQQRSPTFLAPGTGFVEESFSTDGGGVGGGERFRR